MNHRESEILIWKHSVGVASLSPVGGKNLWANEMPPRRGHGPAAPRADYWRRSVDLSTPTSTNAAPISVKGQLGADRVVRLKSSGAKPFDLLHSFRNAGCSGMNFLRIVIPLLFFEHDLFAKPVSAFRTML
jgi:hypothetical protein